MPDQAANIVSFGQLVGQSALTARLAAALEQGRIAHAYIFTGPSGSGKRTMAALFAQALLCRSAGPKPCNGCPACHRVASGNHPDLHEIRPAEEGKSLGVDEARGLQRLIDVKPYEGGRAIVIVHAAQDMTVQAQNAILKTLEEPPEHVVLMLLAESLSALLPTVLSRCAVLKPARLSPEEMRSVLASRGYPPGPRTDRAAALADGRPGEALRLLSDEAFWTLRDKAMAALERLVRNKALAEAMSFAQENRNNAGRFLWVWEAAVRDAAVAASGAAVPLLSDSTLVFLKDLSGERLENMLSACASTRRSLDGNAQYAATMDNLLIELSGGI